MKIFIHKRRKGRAVECRIIWFLFVRLMWESRIRRAVLGQRRLNSIVLLWKIAEPTEAVPSSSLHWQYKCQIYTLARYVRTQLSNPFREIQLTGSEPWHFQPCELFDMPFHFRSSTFFGGCFACIVFPFIYLFWSLMLMVNGCARNWMQ